MQRLTDRQVREFSRYFNEKNGTRYAFVQEIQPHTGDNPAAYLRTTLPLSLEEIRKGGIIRKELHVIFYSVMDGGKDSLMTYIYLRPVKYIEYVDGKWVQERVHAKNGKNKLLYRFHLPSKSFQEEEYPTTEKAQN